MSIPRKFQPDSNTFTIVLLRSDIQTDRRTDSICSYLDIQGDSKVHTFVLPLDSMSYGAQKKYYCQIRAEILKFMWAGKKC
jgi:hypothetical protein